jgi:hypothetical protein
VVAKGVTADGPAERAGVRSGDIILTADGREPKTSRGLAEIIQSMAPGREVTLEIARVGQGSADLMQSLRARADAGSVDAMMALGTLLQVEVGGVKDEAEVARLYRKAAELNDSQGMFNLGNLYMEGRGVSKDQAEAARWYRKAAEAGLPAAMYYLGVLHYEGRGIAKDATEAARWYRKGAEAGNADAMSNLGILYHNGWGVGLDPEQAAAWMFQALQKGHAPTVESLTTNRDTFSISFRRALQRRLKEAGVFDGPIDGIMGPATMSAVKELASRSSP